MAAQQPWNPALDFRARRDHRREDATVLEAYAEKYLPSFLRQAFPPSAPGFNFSPMIQDAVNIVKNISEIERNPELLDQAVFGAAHPALCHPGVKDIAENRELLILLLIRHFQKFGGLILPPLQEVRDLDAAFERTIRADKEAGRAPTLIKYPNWRDMQELDPSPAYARGVPMASRGGRGGGAAGRSGLGRGTGVN